MLYGKMYVEEDPEPGKGQRLVIECVNRNIPDHCEFPSVIGSDTTRIMPASSVVVSPEAKEMFEKIFTYKNLQNIKHSYLFPEFTFLSSRRRSVFAFKSERGNCYKTLHLDQIVTLDSKYLDVSIIRRMPLMSNEEVAKLDISEPVDEKDLPILQAGIPDEEDW